MEHSNILVSVCTLTYNQEKYIKQTVDSLLMQETDFEFEIIISDDGSTDKTPEIIKEIIKTHPKGHLIKFLEHENLGVLPNYIYTFKHCKGKYIAFCEGDDYWTNPNKLSIQANYLEKNPQYSISFHQVNKTENEKKIDVVPNFDIEKQFTLEDLAKHPLMYTPSVMIKFDTKKIPDWYVESPLFDYPLQLFAAREGKIAYLPHNMANYRVGTGLWTSEHGTKNLKKLVLLMTLLMREFAQDKKLFSIFSERRSEYEKTIIEHEFYLKFFSGDIDLTKVNLKSVFKLLVNKINSKLRG